MKKYIWAIIGLVIVGTIWAGISSWSARKNVETAVESQTGGDLNLNADSTATYTNDQGSFSTTGSLPSNWPSDAPQYKGDIVYSGYTNPTEESDTSGASVSLTTKDSVDAITAFYKQSLSDNGWSISGESNINGTEIISATKDNRTYSLSIAPGEDVNSVTASISTN